MMGSISHPYNVHMYYSMLRRTVQYYTVRCDAARGGVQNSPIRELPLTL